MFYLVQGDTSSKIKTQLTRNDTGDVVDLSGASTLLKIRKKGTTTVVASIPGTSSDPTSGNIIFEFGTALDTLVGYYEGEVEVTFLGGGVESVYELISLQVREDF